MKGKVILGAILRSGWACRALCAISVLQLLLTGFGLAGWPCPLRGACGYPCPGCGLTRAIQALLRGHWVEMARLHAFAPIALCVIPLLVAGAVAPVRHRAALAARVEGVELRTGITFAVLVTLLAYWLLRVAFVPEGAWRT